MTTRAEAAADLRRLADEVEAGAISYPGGTLTVPERFEREIEIEREDKAGGVVKYELEVELEWTESAR